jgi:lipopolysaccharide/colanic/teichoic acid biosynthesis glycosyltransferase
MHVLLIHQAFVPPTEAGGTRHYELATEAVRDGHQFTVIASSLSYLTGRSMVGQRRWIVDQESERIRIRRVATPALLHKGFTWRVLSFLTFTLNSVFAALGAGPVSLVIGTSPPIFQAVSAWLVSVLRRCPFLLEIRDLWPAFAVDMGVLRNPLLIRLSTWLERFLYAHATHIVINSPGYRDHLLAHGVPATKISLIANGVDPQMFDPAARGEDVRRRLGLEGRFVVTYAGALGRANDIPTLLRAAEQLCDDPSIHFLLVGDGMERPGLEAMARERGLRNVTFLGSRPKREMPDILAASDACVAILQDIPMFRTTYPNKVFDYMAAGRPTILAIDGVIRQVLEDAGGGISVPPGSDTDLAAAVRRLRQDPSLGRAMGAAARLHVEQHFDRQRQAAEFTSLLQRVAAARPSGFYQRFGKRVLDLIVVLAVSLIVIALLGLVALAVRLTVGRPVFFCQPRLGLDGRPFTVLKFRTMRDLHDDSGRMLPDAERLTRLGRWLRTTSLDELPELVNVLRGNMSLVGPRPLLAQYRERYSAQQMRRHDVMPGITGWAQINGRNAISWDERFDLDVWYVEHQSLRLDLKILARTFFAIWRRDGISQPGHATAEEFRGNAKAGEPGPSETLQTTAGSSSDVGPGEGVA